MRELTGRSLSFTVAAMLFCAILSFVVHLLLSWGLRLDDVAVESQSLPKIINVTKPISREPIAPPPPEEPLQFDQDLELEPPDILIAPRAVVPPPPERLVSLRAQAAGFTGLDLPSRSIPTVAFSMGYGGTRAGIGNSIGDGQSQFGAYIESLRETGFDIVFVVDATGSMGWVLTEVKNRISEIARFIRSLVPIARFGFVAYRDNDDPEFVTKVFPLTFSTAKLQGFLANLKAQGGGDWYEEIDAGISAAIENSGWRAGASKLIILIGDAPMHADDLPNVIRMVEAFGQNRGMVSALDVSEQANPHLVELKLGHKVKRTLYRDAPMRDFRTISDAGNGDAATLERDIELTQRLVHLIIGDKFAREIEGLFDALAD